MKKIIMTLCFLFVVSPVFAATNNEGLWVRNWVGWGETQHWTDISDMLVEGGGAEPFTETDPIFEDWKNSTYQTDQNLQWNAINNNTTWNMIQQGQINYLSNENVAQWQALADESMVRQFYDQLLNNKITVVDYKSKMRDLYLNNKIDVETYKRMVADRAIHTASLWRDAQLAGMIGEVDENSIQRDRALHNMISDNSRRIQNNSDRIKSLEDPKFNIIGSVRFHDSKNWQIKAFAAYDVTNERLDRYGLEFMYKMGPSYEEKLIKELQEKIAALEAKQ